MLCCYLIKLDTCDRVERSMWLVGKTKLIKASRRPCGHAVQSSCAWLPKVPSPDCPFTTIYQIAFPHSAHNVLFAFAGEKSSRSTDHSEKNEWLVARQARQAWRRL